MDSLLYLLVCEGPSDILMIDRIAKQIASDTGKNIKIRELAPQRDNTTNKYPSHGWEEVRRWCRLYGDSIDTSINSFEALAARSKSWKAQIELSKADGLIIQMDTDIARFISDLGRTYASGTKKSRKKFCSDALLCWLGETIKPADIYFLLSTYSTESWILATHNRQESIFSDLDLDFNFEDIDNVEDRLITLGYKTHIDQISGKTKLTKHENVYKNYAKKVVDNLLVVRTECEESDKLCKFFES